MSEMDFLKCHDFPEIPWPLGSLSTFVFGIYSRKIVSFISNNNNLNIDHSTKETSSRSPSWANSAKQDRFIDHTVLVSTGQWAACSHHRLYCGAQEGGSPNLGKSHYYNCIYY